MLVFDEKKYAMNLVKNKVVEQNRVEDIKTLFQIEYCLNDVILNPLSKIYHIEQKKGNLKDYYTARINKKIRLIMKPIGSYPYNTIEITEIEFVDIDNKHYGEG